MQLRNSKSSENKQEARAVPTHIDVRDNFHSYKINTYSMQNLKMGLLKVHICSDITNKDIYEDIWRMVETFPE